jgi:hypothetical protein
MASDQLRHQIVQPAILPPQRRARAQHGVDQLADQYIAGDRLAHGLRKARADVAVANAKRLQRVPDRVLKVEKLALQIAPVRQQQPQAVAVFALDMRASKPAGPHQMRQTERIGPLGFVALSLQCGAHMLCLEAHRWQAELEQLAMQQGDKAPAS